MGPGTTPRRVTVRFSQGERCYFLRDARDTLFDRRCAVTLGVSADLQVTNGDTHDKTPVKLDFPVAAGVVLPISLTGADRRDVINEKEVRGTFGFTIDTSKLAAALR